VKICNSDKPFGIDVKRFCMATTVTDVCPKCGVEVTKDLRKLYLSYPTANALEEIHFSHENPDESDDSWYEHEWSREVVLRVRLEEA
jgi:hypothetical protein